MTGNGDQLQTLKGVVLVLGNDDRPRDHAALKTSEEVFVVWALKASGAQASTTQAALSLWIPVVSHGRCYVFQLKGMKCACVVAVSGCLMEAFQTFALSVLSCGRRRWCFAGWFLRPLNGGGTRIDASMRPHGGSVGPIQCQRPLRCCGTIWSSVEAAMCWRRD